MNQSVFVSTASAGRAFDQRQLNAPSHRLRSSMHVLQAKTLAPLVVVVIGCRSGESRIPDSTTASTTIASTTASSTIASTTASTTIASTTASTTISHERVVDPQSPVDSEPAGVVRRYYAAIQS